MIRPTIINNNYADPNQHQIGIIEVLASMLVFVSVFVFFVKILFL